MYSRKRTFTVFAAAVVALCAAAAPAAAQEWVDRFSIHGSISSAVGKTDGLGYLGINKDYQTNLRAVALQIGYKVGDGDRVVVQLLHRQLGTSPMQALEPSIAPVWAFYEHRDGDWTFKFGRDPLPRGLFNEVRFIGTLLPFYKVGKDVYGETLENIDGVVVSHRSSFGGWSIDANAFGGGFDVKALLPGTTENLAYAARAEQAYGASAIVRTPIDGVRFGGFIVDYSNTPVSASSHRNTSWMLSADGDWSKGWIRGEYTVFTPHQTTTGNTYEAWYGQAGFKFSEKYQVAVEHGDAKFEVDLPAPFPADHLPFSTYNGVAVNYSPSSNVRFKLEYNKQEGYLFDTPVPLYSGPQSLNPPVMGRAPKSTTNYMIASVAVAF